VFAEKRTKILSIFIFQFWILAIREKRKGASEQSVEENTYFQETSRTITLVSRSKACNSSCIVENEFDSWNPKLGVDIWLKLLLHLCHPAQIEADGTAEGFCQMSQNRLKLLK